jgi:L-ascorbate metabolism protein UlaG (beta-lactamase superfamily)
MNKLIKEIDDTSVNIDSLAIWWIGQNGFIIKSTDLTIYIDPYLSNYAERITLGKSNEHVRMTDSPIPPEEVSNADLVICTHDHADHIDPDGIPLIAKASQHANFIIPECARNTLLNFDISKDRIYTLRGNDELTYMGIKIFAIPAKHEEFDEDELYGFPYLSYVINLGKITILHAGDTIPYDRQVDKFKPHKIDIAFLPINGRDKFRNDLNFEGNFNCKEAVDFAKSVYAKLTIPMHYDMFYINTGDVKEFVKIAQEKGLTYRVLQPSELMRFKKEYEI